MAAIDYATTPARPGLSQIVASPSQSRPLLVLFMIAVVIPFSFGLGPIVMTGVRLILIVTVVPMTIRLLSGRYGRLLPTDILFFLHIFWAMLALWSNNPDRVIQNIGSTGIEFLGGYLLGRAYVRNRQDMFTLIRILVLAIVCTLPLAAFETFTGRSLIIEALRSVPVISGSMQAGSSPRLGLERVQMGFVTPIHFGLFSMLGLSFCYIGLKNQISNFKRLVGAGICCLCVFFSLSSGALLPVILQLYMFAWAAMFAKNTQRWWILLGLIVAGYIVVDLLSNRTPMRVFMHYATFSSGTAYMRAAINMFGMDNVWANPIFGIGLNDWKRADWLHNNSVDNYWLVMAMRYGIPGFLAVAAGYGIALTQLIRRDFSDDAVLAQLRLAWVFTFGSLAFALYTVHIWAEIYALIFFVLGAGMWMVTAEPDTGTDARPAPASLPPGATTRFAPGAVAQATTSRPGRSAVTSRAPGSRTILTRTPVDTADTARATPDRAPSPRTVRASTRTPEAPRHSRFTRPDPAPDGDPDPTG